VEEHLAQCDVCSREVADLRPLAASPRRKRTALVAGLAAAAAAVIIAFTVLRRSADHPVTPRPVPPPAIVVHPTDPLHPGGVDAAMSARIAEVLRNPNLAAPAVLSALNPTSGSLRGTAANRDLEILSPIGIVTLDARPRFQWRGKASARYDVSLFDDAMREWNGHTNTTEWIPPSDLPRGKTYTWQVSTIINGHRIVAPAPPEPEATFRIVDEKTLAAIRDAKSHLVAGLLCYDAGAITEARREFEALAAESPASDVPRRLIESCDRVGRR